MENGISIWGWGDWLATVSEAFSCTIYCSVLIPLMQSTGEALSREHWLSNGWLWHRAALIRKHRLTLSCIQITWTIQNHLWPFTSLLDFSQWLNWKKSIETDYTVHPFLLRDFCDILSFLSRYSPETVYSRGIWMGRDAWDAWLACLAVWLSSWASLAS